MPVFYDQTSMLKFIWLMKKKNMFPRSIELILQGKGVFQRGKLKEGKTLSFGKSGYTR